MNKTAQNTGNNNNNNNRKISVLKKEAGKF